MLGDPYDKTDERVLAVLRPLQQQVRDQGLWAATSAPSSAGRATAR